MQKSQDAPPTQSTAALLRLPTVSPLDRDSPGPRRPWTLGMQPLVTWAASSEQRQVEAGLECPRRAWERGRVC